jgi:hypothetical protein
MTPAQNGGLGVIKELALKPPSAYGQGVYNAKYGNENQ